MFIKSLYTFFFKFCIGVVRSKGLSPKFKESQSNSHVNLKPFRAPSLTQCPEMSLGVFTKAFIIWTHCSHGSGVMGAWKCSFLNQAPKQMNLKNTMIFSPCSQTTRIFPEVQVKTLPTAIGLQCCVCVKLLSMMGLLQ